MKLPRILMKSICFADDDHLDPQAHENTDDGGGGGTATATEADTEKRKAAFFDKFSASKNAPPDKGGDVGNDANQQAVKQQTEEAKAKAEDQQKKHKRPGENLPTILENKRKAEAERDELKAKAEKYEKEEKPALEAKIAEYEKKLEGDLPAHKVKEYEEKIVQLEKQQLEKETNLVNENQKLKKTLAYHDLAGSEEFKEKYEAPAVAAHKDCLKVIGKDPQKNAALHRALIANSAALSATTDEDREMAERERNEIIGSMLESMNQYESQNFGLAISQYIKASERHREALLNHEQTRAKIQSEASERANQAQAERIQTWGNTFKSTAAEFADEEKLSDEEVKIAADLGFDIDKEKEKNSVLAEKVITGRSTMIEAMEVVHRGRTNPLLKIRVKVLEKLLEDSRALVKTMTGGGTGGGDSNGASGRPKSSATKNSAGESLNPKGETREEWQQRRFGAHRAHD